jgi:YVTN family beta-propeller protein
MWWARKECGGVSTETKGAATVPTLERNPCLPDDEALPSDQGAAALRPGASRGGTMGTLRVTLGVRRLLSRRGWVTLIITGAIIALTAGGAWAAMAVLVAGPQPDGTSVTPQGWRVTPAGTQTSLGSGPLGIAVSRDGKLALVTNAGYGNHSLMVVHTATGAVVQTIGTQSNAVRAEKNRVLGRVYAHFYYQGGSFGYSNGIAFAPDGSTAYASDAPGSGIHTFTVKGGLLKEGQEIGLRSGSWPAGIAVSPSGSRLFVAANLTDQLLIVDPVARKTIATIAVGHSPYDVALNHSGSLAFVSNWGGRTVTVVDTTRGAVVKTLSVGEHPSAIALNPVNRELYIANTDSDTITVVDSDSATVLRTIDERPFSGAQVGASPDGLAVSPDGTTLYVANAGDNDVAVVKLVTAGSTSAADKIAGMIPTAWYPSALAINPAGSTLFVVNMKGLGVGPVQPGQYLGLLMQGSLSCIPMPGATQLRAFTATVASNGHFGTVAPAGDGSVIPKTVGASSPIKHVIYVLKENRTYDQVLGDLGRGNGDPSLTMFPESVTPNQHALARQFVDLDNFYCDGEVSADGWMWSTASYANTYNQKNWPLDYSIWGRPYDFGGFANVAADPDNTETAGFPGPDPRKCFLWDDLGAHGVSYRNYGFFIGALPALVPATMPGLAGHTDLDYSGWDLKYTDQARIDAWLREFQGFQSSGQMPTVQLVYLPRDHTMNTASQQPTPTAMVADNDLALGRLVDAVSHSRFWSSTAIFVVEDDAQDGPDHVDAHRTIAQVISPYSQLGTVDSTFYSTVSMLRTIELLVGAPPLTQFDAAATPMSDCFSSSANLRPYTAIVPGTSLTTTNSASAPMAAVAAKWDYSAPDRVPEHLADIALWRDTMGNRPLPTALLRGGAD